MKYHKSYLLTGCLVALVTYDSAAAGNGGGNEPHGDVYNCIQEAKRFLTEVRDIDQTYAKIQREWSCLSVEEINLCKTTTVVAYNLQLNGKSKLAIDTAIHDSGAWTAGECQ